MPVRVGRTGWVGGGCGRAGAEWSAGRACLPGEELRVEEVPRLKSGLWRDRRNKALSRPSTWECRT